MSEWDDVTFTITATMKRRWVPHFLGLLDFMVRCGQLGMSRRAAFYADGDGDFRPAFRWSTDEEPAEPIEGNPDEPMWDAG
jgi:hypothetical protein